MAITGALDEIYSGGTEIIGDGSTTEFEFDFEYVNENDIFYQIGDNDPIRFTSNLGIVNNNTVIFDTAPANGEEGKIIRQSNLIRQTDPLVGFSNDNLNLEFNNVYSIMQELKVNAQGYGEQLNTEIETLKNSNTYKKGDIAFFSDGNPAEGWVVADGSLIPSDSYDLEEQGYTITYNVLNYTYNNNNINIDGNDGRSIRRFYNFDDKWIFQEVSLDGETTSFYETSDNNFSSTKTLISSNNFYAESLERNKVYLTGRRTGFIACSDPNDNQTTKIYYAKNTISTGNNIYLYSIPINVRYIDIIPVNQNECKVIYGTNTGAIDEITFNDLNDTYVKNTINLSGVIFNRFINSAKTLAKSQVEDGNFAYYNDNIGKRIFRIDISNNTISEYYDYGDQEIGFNTKTYANDFKYISASYKIFLLGEKLSDTTSTIDILIDKNGLKERKTITLPRIEYGTDVDPMIDFVRNDFKEVKALYIERDYIFIRQGRVLHKTVNNFNTIESEFLLSSTGSGNTLGNFTKYNFLEGVFLKPSNDDNLYSLLTVGYYDFSYFTVDRLYIIEADLSPEGFYELPDYSSFNRGLVKAYIKVE